jgi:hypothetical protein
VIGIYGGWACAFLSLARPAGSAPPLFPSSSVRAMRSPASPAALTEAGARVHRGDLDDPGGLRGAAGASDGVIHLAFNVDMVRSGDFQGAVGADRRAVEALGEALTGSDRPLVIASATVVLAPGRVGTEQDAPGLSRTS